MNYWHNVMHDDVFMVMNEGWMDAAQPRKTIEDKGRKLSETPDLVVGSGRGITKYKTDLIPPVFIVAHYFADKQAKVDELHIAADEATRAVEEYTEEHAVEDGLLAETIDDGKITKALVTARLKDAKNEASDSDEIKALQHLIKLYTDEAAAKQATKNAQAALDLATLNKYGQLTQPVIKQLVLDDKWHATIVARIACEVNSLILALVARIQELGERYAETVEDLDAKLTWLDSRVAAHLADMGVKQGMMQQLLTGKARLPGFTQPWREVRLGDVAQFSKGNGLPKSDVVDDGRFPCVHYGELFTHYGTEIYEVSSRTNRSNLPVRSAHMDVLMPTSDVTPKGLAKASAINRSDVILGGDILVIRPNQAYIYGPFLAHSIRADASQVLQLVRGSTVFHLYATDMKGFTFRVPDTKEQEAICAVLREVQTHVELLKRRHDKAKAVKQGMMQELLTGRTRLPVAEARYE